jgi:hypothetical protein
MEYIIQTENLSKYYKGQGNIYISTSKLNIWIVRPK